MTIFYNFYTTSNHLHSLQVENCDSNSRLVVNEDDNGKFRPERVNITAIKYQFKSLSKVKLIVSAGCDCIITVKRLLQIHPFLVSSKSVLERKCQTTRGEVPIYTLFCLFF